MNEHTPSTPTEVTQHLLNDIKTGTYAVGDALPTLDQINEQYFGHRGPKPGRAAYAPLIAAGMIETRQGRHGGHFLTRTTPADVTDTTVLAPFTGPLDAIAEQLKTLRAIELTVVEFYELATGEYFGACLHTSRLAAENYAIAILTHLGDTHPQLAEIIHRATYAASDINHYAVRIHGRTLAGNNTFNDDRTAINGPYRPDS